jgi:hypothetical protein
MTAPADSTTTALTTPDVDAAAFPKLADLRPADPALLQEVRSLAGPLSSAIAMLSPESRAGRLVHDIDAVLTDGGRPEDPGKVAMLMVPLLDANCRAAACSAIGTGEEARPHLDLWLWVARYTLGAPPECLPLTIAGFAAARAGADGLARDCYDRALEGAPGLADTRFYRDALEARTAPQFLHPHYPPLA